MHSVSAIQGFGIISVLCECGVVLYLFSASRSPVVEGGLISIRGANSLVFAAGGTPRQKKCTIKIVAVSWRCVGLEFWVFGVGVCSCPCVLGTSDGMSSARPRASRRSKTREQAANPRLGDSRLCRSHSSETSQLCFRVRMSSSYRHHRSSPCSPHHVVITRSAPPPPRPPPHPAPQIPHAAPLS